MRTIPITKAVFDEAERSAILKPLESGWVVQGPFVKQFEQLFAEFVGCQYAKAVSNCTTALHLSLLALGIGPGDKVVVPAFTYIASANAVEYTGAEVVFCEIDYETFNIDTKHLASLVSQDPKIKAIMPVHLFGLCADLTAIQQIVANKGIFIIEDSACGFDAWIQNKHSGTFGEMGCFSFHPRKSITTGEGGMIVTDDEALYHLVSQLCDHGAAKSDLMRHKEKGGSLLPDFTLRGYNYRMTDFQGALGVCQMQKASTIMEKRRNLARQYDEALSQIAALERPKVPEGYQHGYQSYVCWFTLGVAPSDFTLETIHSLNQKRNAFMHYLETQGIATRQGTHAVHTLSYYAKRYNLRPQDFLMAYAADQLSITLPLYAQMQPDEFQYVMDHIHEGLLGI
jgi:perosamine synthetase